MTSEKSVSKVTPGLTVKANTPVRLSFDLVDPYGNIALLDNTFGGAVILVDPSGGAFRLTPGGANVQYAAFPPGTSSVTLYYVNPVAGTYPVEFYFQISPP